MGWTQAQKDQAKATRERNKKIKEEAGQPSAASVKIPGAGPGASITEEINACINQLYALKNRIQAIVGND